MVPVRLTVSPSLISAVRAEDHDADVVGFEVEGHALDAVGEFDHFAGLDLVEAVDAGDAVTHREHLADFRDLGLGAEVGDLVLDDLRDFCGADFHVQPFIACARVLRRVRIELSICRLPILTTRPPRRSGGCCIAADLRVANQSGQVGRLPSGPRPAFEILFDRGHGLVSLANS
jgi:hypothetical protein